MKWKFPIYESLEKNFCITLFQQIGEGFLPTPREMILSNDTTTQKNEIERIIAVAQMLGATVAQKSSTMRTMQQMKMEEIINLFSNQEGDTDTKQKGGMNERIDIPSSTKNLNDTLVELFFAHKSSKRKMQMRRSESVIVLDGIAPSSEKVGLHAKLQRQTEASATNETNPGEEKPSQAVKDVYNLWNFIYELAKVIQSFKKIMRLKYIPKIKFLIH